jgi:TRAP-type C4-dicarboxylate transport system permease small subunit
LWATVVFCVYISALAIEHVFGEFGDFHSGETRPSTGLPSWTITLPVLIAFVLMTLRFGSAAVDAMSNPSKPASGGGHS